MPAPNKRYDGKPFLKLLDSYVLWAIDELPKENAQALTEMTPKLRAIYGNGGDWQQIVCAVMKLPSNMPVLIREVWVKNTEIARKNGATLIPIEFAEMFVDRNLTS